MNDEAIPVKPTASGLKNELRESLEILRTDFESLKHFVSELSSDAVSAAPVSLTKDDLNDLLVVTQEIQDAANNIEFEANKIKATLSRLVL